MSASGLTGALPGDLVVTEFAGTINKHSKGRGERRRNLITAPPVCPPGSRKWNNTGSFTFQNGDTDSGSSKGPCKTGDQLAAQKSHKACTDRAARTEGWLTVAGSPRKRSQVGIMATATRR